MSNRSKRDIKKQLFVKLIIRIDFRSINDPLNTNPRSMYVLLSLNRLNHITQLPPETAHVIYTP